MTKHAWTFGSTGGFRIENDEEELTYLKVDYGSFPYTKAIGSGTEQVIIQLLFPVAEGRGGPQVSSVKNGNQIVVAVQDGDVTDTFLLQPSLKTATFGKSETDATFAWTRESGGKLSHYAVREATNLKSNGAVLMESKDPRTEAKEQ